MNTKEQLEIASIKLALIQPTFNDTYPDASKTAYYKRVAAEPIRLSGGKELHYKWNSLSSFESDYRKGGFEALIPKNRNDKGMSRKLDSDTMARIHLLREQFPKINATQIYFKLIEEGMIKKQDVSVNTIQRYVKRHNLKGANAPGMKDRKAFEEEYAGGLYQADTLYGPYIAEAGSTKRHRTYCIMTLDDKTRMIVGGQFFYADNAMNFQRVLKSAVATYGIPTKLYVDSGSPYKNEQLSLICGSLGIVLLHTPIRDGASKGKAERNFRTLRNRFLNILNTDELSGIEELNSRLNDYIRQHNTTIHSSTSMTPSDRYLTDITHITMPRSQEWLDNCFHNRILRLVKNDATVVIDHVLYDVPMEFIRSKVEIRYLPDDMEHAYIYYEEKQYPIRKTNKVENSRTKRKNEYQITYGEGEPNV